MGMLTIRALDSFLLISRTNNHGTLPCCEDVFWLSSHNLARLMRGRKGRVELSVKERGLSAEARGSDGGRTSIKQSMSSARWGSVVMGK